jgi:hypothetical protein
MAKKVVIALVAIAAVSAYLTVKEEGSEKAFGGLLAPISPARFDDDGRAEPAAGRATGESIPQISQTDYKQLVDRVRTRTNAAMDKSVERASR